MPIDDNYKSDVTYKEEAKFNERGSRGLWAVLALVALFAIGGLMWAFSGAENQSASNTPAVTTGSGSVETTGSGSTIPPSTRPASPVPAR